MNTASDQALTSTRDRILAIAFGIALAWFGTSGAAQGSAQDGTHPVVKRMPDGKDWQTENLNLATAESYCYRDAERNCRRYGRLYTWQAAQSACRSLGDGWRLPTDDDWRELARHYGGIADDSDDRGKAAYEALLRGGSSGFNAILGGGRAAQDGRYDDLKAHGFYWSASASSAAGAWFYNFGRGSTGFYRQSDGEEQMALAVRCVRE